MFDSLSNKMQFAFDMKDFVQDGSLSCFVLVQWQAIGWLPSAAFSQHLTTFLFGKIEKMSVLTGKPGNKGTSVGLVFISLIKVQCAGCRSLFPGKEDLQPDPSAAHFPPVLPRSGLALPLGFSTSHWHKSPVQHVLRGQCHSRAVGQAGGVTPWEEGLGWELWGWDGWCWGGFPWGALPAFPGTRMCLLQLGWKTIFQLMQR